MLAVMEENDICTVAANLGQARVLLRLAQSCKRPLEAPPALTQPHTPMRSRSSSFSHRSDVYHQMQHQHNPPQTLAMDPQLMTPLTPGAMQTISPRMAEAMARRPSSVPSQHLLEASGDYPGAAPRTTYAYSQHAAMPGMQMMLQHMTGSMPAMPGKPQHMPVACQL